MSNGIFAGVEDSLLLSVEFDHRHFTSGESASKTGADLSDLAHALGSIEVADKDCLLLVHASGGVSKGNGNRHGETLRDGNHNQNNEKSDVLEQLLHEDLATNFLVNTGLDALNNDGGDQDNSGCNDANEGEGFGQRPKLLLQSSLRSVQFVSHLRAGREKANAGYNSNTRSIDQLLVSHEERLFLISGMVDTFTSFSVRLNNFDAVRPDDNAISRDNISSIKDDDVTNDKFPHVNGLHLSHFAAEDGQIAVASNGLELDEVLIFNKVVQRSDHDHDENHNVNGYTFNPTGFGTVYHAEDDGKGCANSKDHQNFVLERLL